MEQPDNLVEERIESFATYEDAEKIMQKLLNNQENLVKATMDKGDKHYKVHWKEWTK